MRLIKTLFWYSVVTALVLATITYLVVAGRMVWKGYVG
jgi:hypothetical protein